MTISWRVKYNRAATAALDARVARWRAEQSGDLSDKRDAREAEERCEDAIAAFDTFWRHEATSAELQDICKECHRYLPQITLENGTQARTEVLRPPSQEPDGQAFEAAWSDADNFQRYLAEIQFELACRLEGPPPTETALWAKANADVRAKLLLLIDIPEPTIGAESMSQRAHAVDALQLLDDIDQLASMLSRATLKDDDAAANIGEPLEHEQRWLLEGFAQISHMAFEAGMNAQIALGKKWEPHALRGAKNLDVLTANGKHRREKTAPETNIILQFMENALSQNARMGKSEAARLAHSEGLGSSVEANRRLWGRHRKGK